MAFIRNVLLLGAVVAVLPTDAAQQARFYEQVTGAVHWTATFCDRNAKLCDEGQAMWATFVKKAEFGAEVAYDLIQRQIGGGDDAAAKPARLDKAPAARGTLRPDDLEPGWRGKPGRGA